MTACKLLSRNCTCLVWRSRSKCDCKKPLATNSAMPDQPIGRCPLELVLQDELLVRQQRQIERRVKSANFREVKTLDHFDW